MRYQRDKYLWKTSFLYQMKKQTKTKQIWQEELYYYLKKTTRISDIICPKNAVRFLAYPYHVCAFVEDTVVDARKCQDKKKQKHILFQTYWKQ